MSKLTGKRKGVVSLLLALASISLVLLLWLFGGAAVMAQSDCPEDKVIIGGDFPEGPEDKVIIHELSVAEFWEMQKMSPEAEAAIVHQVPPRPVVIDGILYEPEQIHLFDGQRLGFTVGVDGVLYAFTTEEGIERFREEQRKLRSGQETSESYSYFWEHWFYGGWSIGLLPGVAANLFGAFDNEISSVNVSSAASWARLYEDHGLQGNFFEIAGGESVPWLWWHRWNDRASSLFVHP